MKKKTAPKRTKTKSRLDMLTFVACDAVSRDPTTDKCSIYGLFDIVYGDKFPLTHKAFAVFAKLQGDKGKYPLALKLVAPDGERTNLGKFEIDITKTGLAATEIQVVGLQFPQPGKYQLAMQTGRRTLGKPITIIAKRSSEISTK